MDNDNKKINKSPLDIDDMLNARLEGREQRQELADSNDNKKKSVSNKQFIQIVLIAGAIFLAIVIVVVVSIIINHNTNQYNVDKENLSVEDIAKANNTTFTTGLRVNGVEIMLGDSINNLNPEQSGWIVLVGKNPTTDLKEKVYPSITEVINLVPNENLEFNNYIQAVSPSADAGQTVGGFLLYKLYVAPSKLEDNMTYKIGDYVVTKESTFDELREALSKIGQSGFENNKYSTTEKSYVDDNGVMHRDQENKLWYDVQGSLNYHGWKIDLVEQDGFITIEYEFSLKASDSYIY